MSGASKVVLLEDCLRRYARYEKTLEGVELPRSGFGSKQESDSKKLARAQVYLAAARYLRELKTEAPWSVLMLAGKCPAHEIAVAKEVFQIEDPMRPMEDDGYSVPLVAIDRDQQAVDAAKKEGVLSYRFDLQDLRKSGSFENWPLPGAPSHFDFVNLDLCHLVTTEGIGRSFERACAVGTIIATWFSYGHEDLKKIDRGYTWVGPQTKKHLRNVPEKIAKRLDYAWSHMSGTSGWGRNFRRPNLLEVISYVGNRMPMFVALWSNLLGIDFLVPDVVPYIKIFKENYRDVVIDVAEMHGNDWSAKVHGCSTAQIAAWKAVKTRRRVGK